MRNERAIRVGIAAAVLAGTAALSTNAGATPIRITNLLGWDDGTETCLDNDSGLGCPGLITFSNPVADLGLQDDAAGTQVDDAHRTISWRSGIDDPDLSSLDATGETFVINPGERELLSTFVHNNEVLSPFDEFFTWEMELKVNISFETPGADGVFDTADDVLLPESPFSIPFQFVETLNNDPCDVVIPPAFGPSPVDNPNNTTCDDRYIGQGAAVLVAPINLGALGTLVIDVVESGDIDFVNDGTDLTVHTGEPNDSTLQFFVTLNAVQMSEPSTLALVGGLMFTAGVAGVGTRRRRRNA